jgi:tartrate/fumarate subfamily iron-sulfur-dependent hydro-lyase beta chain
MSKVHHLTLPFTEEQVRDLKVGDSVYLSGSLYTMRDMGHRRAVEMIRRGEALPFDLAAGAIWHCGPIVRKVEGQWQVVSAGSTTSSRFTPLGSELMRALKVRCIVGKGTMGAEAVTTMGEIGSCFLNSTGGCASLYAQQLAGVEAVYWTDLGLPEATWVLRANDLGPLVVGIDTHGESIFESRRKEMARVLPGIYERSHLDPAYALSYLPKRVTGKAGW